MTWISKILGTKSSPKSQQVVRKQEHGLLALRTWEGSLALQEMWHDLRNRVAHQSYCH